ncbi:MAG: lipoprotein [Pseudomonadota bacterium]
MQRLAKTLICLASLAALSACGLQGDLTRPDPLFGTPNELEPAEPLDRRVTDGLDDFRDERTSQGEGGDDAPDPEDELLGGPSAPAR